MTGGSSRSSHGKGATTTLSTGSTASPPQRDAAQRETLQDRVRPPLDPANAPDGGADPRVTPKPEPVHCRFRDDGPLGAGVDDEAGGPAVHVHARHEQSRSNFKRHGGAAFDLASERRAARDPDQHGSASGRHHERPYAISPLAGGTTIRGLKQERQSGGEPR